MILDPNTVSRELRLRADVCVVGSGAGGAVVARELAEAGLHVVVFEEGRYNTSRDFDQREVEMYPRLYREQASPATADFSVLVLQGRTLGGSTVPSFCIAARPPAAILDAWQQTGLAGAGSAVMAPYFERVEKALEVKLTLDAEVNANNARFRTGAEALGLRCKPVWHSRVECVGCGYCSLGCAYDRKNDALTRYLPAASRAGALLVPQCAVQMIEVKNGRAVAVGGNLWREDGRRIPMRVSARAVVLAAGAVGSPRLWLRNRLPDTNRNVGRHLHLHPQVVVQALFEQRIEGWNGVPQCFVVDQYVRDEPSGGGFWLAPSFAHPVTAAALAPGFGDEHRRWMERYDRLAMTTVFLHDRSEGRVDIDTEGRAVVDYHLIDDDRADLLEGMQRAAELLLAAGAVEVALPFTERTVLTDVRQPLPAHGVRASDPFLVSYQPHGTLRMGKDARTSVVDPTGEAHEVKGLYVADASLFPTALAAPPQLSVMAFATRVAEKVRATI